MQRMKWWQMEYHSNVWIKVSVCWSSLQTNFSTQRQYTHRKWKVTKKTVKWFFVLNDKIQTYIMFILSSILLFTKNVLFEHQPNFTFISVYFTLYIYDIHMNINKMHNALVVFFSWSLCWIVWRRTTEYGHIRKEHTTHKEKQRKRMKDKKKQWETRAFSTTERQSECR